MNTLTLEEDPIAVDLAVTCETLEVKLADGRSLSVPIQTTSGVSLSL